MITVTKPTLLGDLCTPKHEPLKVGDVVRSEYGHKYQIIHDMDNYLLLSMPECVVQSAKRARVNFGIPLDRESAKMLCAPLDKWSRNGVPLADIYAPAQEPKLEAGMRLRDAKGTEFLAVRNHSHIYLLNVATFTCESPCHENNLNLPPEMHFGPDWRDWQLLPNEDKREPKWEWRWFQSHYGEWSCQQGYNIYVQEKGSFSCWISGGREAFANRPTLKAAKLACEDHAEGKGE